MILYIYIYISLVVLTILQNMSSSMGRIIPYIMEKLKMFQTTNQISMHMPVVTVLIDTLPSRDNMAIDGVQTRLCLWSHYNGALTLIVLGSWSHKKSGPFRFPVPLRDFMMYKLTLPMSWCRTLVCFFGISPSSNHVRNWKFETDLEFRSASWITKL